MSEVTNFNDIEEIRQGRKVVCTNCYKTIGSQDKVWIDRTNNVFCSQNCLAVFNSKIGSSVKLQDAINKWPFMLW